MLRDMVAQMLETDGFSVLTAGSGPDAIDLSRSHQGEIDLLLSDVRMPVMDGCTLANHLQAENPTLPVLLMSGYWENEVHRCGGFPILPKPFSMKSLLGLVRDLLKPTRRASRAESLNSFPELPAQCGEHCK
jgi:two-component system cell cycle sensor histidine kinase/response regulator CckA